MFGERVVESVVFEGEVLVKGRDLVDNGEGQHKNTIALLVELGRRLCARKGRPCTMMR